MRACPKCVFGGFEGVSDAGFFVLGNPSSIEGWRTEEEKGI